MKTNKNSYSFSLSAITMILFSILFSSTAIAQNASPMITLTQITNDTTALSPAIYGDRIVYEDWFNGTYGEYGDYYGNWDIYMYNISTSEKIRINTSESTCITPDIYGDRVVYVNWINRGHRGDVYMYNLSSNKETRITTNGLESYPQIYDNTVVWLESSNVSDINSDIYMYNLSTLKETQVTNHSRNDYKPAIYGNNIVWQDFHNENQLTDIHIYNISTSEENQIITNRSAAFPDIYGDKIVWDENYSIYMYDLSTHQVTQITNWSSAFPAIYGNNIVWQDYRYGNNWNIYMYNASSHEETQISNESIGQWHPTIYGNRIVWEYWYDNYIDADIYMATISGEEPEAKTLIANFTANPPNGYVPLTVQFTDISQNATGWNWDFGDGTNSTFQNPEHTYSSSGDYVVNLTLSNENVNVSKTTTIHVYYRTDPYNPYDSGSGTSGGGGSPEPATNVEVKELSQAIVTSGNSAKFDFPKNSTSVVYVSFDSKKNIGRTTTTVEMLKNKSALTSETPIGEVYKYLNIWVGSSGFGTSKNIENSIVIFKVEKSWIQGKNIDQSSIALNMYSDKKWDQLSTNLSGEDDKYMYFTAQTPSFSSFVITGKIKATGTETQPSTDNKTQSAVSSLQSKSTNGSTATNVEQIPEQKQSINDSGKESIKTPGFEISSGIVCLFCAFLYKRR